MRFKLKEWLKEKFERIEEKHPIFMKGFFTFAAGFFTFAISLYWAWSVILSKNIFSKNFPIFNSFFDNFEPFFNIVFNYYVFYEHMAALGPFFYLISLLVSCVFSFLLYNKRINWWLIVTIFVTLIIYIWGISFIDDYVGEKEMKFELKNNNSEKSYKINCNGVRGSIIADEIVTCKIQGFSSFNVKVILTLANGSKVEKYYNNSTKINFTLPENLIKTEFTLNDTSGNETKQLTDSLTTTYPTYAEFRENKNVFIQYAAILIAFLLVSVPTFMTKLKELIEGNEHKEKEKELKKLIHENRERDKTNR